MPRPLVRPAVRVTFAASHRTRENAPLRLRQGSGGSLPVSDVRRLCGALWRGWLVLAVVALVAVILGAGVAVPAVLQRVRIVKPSADTFAAFLALLCPSSSL